MSTLRWMHPGLLTAVALACGGSPPVEPPAPDPRRDSIDVEVINQNYYEANIYAIYGGSLRRRVGHVRGTGTRTNFVIPWHPRSLAFEIDFVIGPGTYLSDRVDVARGDAVELTIPPNIDESGFFRRVIK